MAQGNWQAIGGGGGAGDVVSSAPIFSGSQVTTANAMAGTVIDVTKGLNTKSVAADTTFTFSGTPASSNTWFTPRCWRVPNHDW